MERWSVVRNVKIINTLFSPIIQVGDNIAICPKSKALAIQRQYPIYRGDEGEFADYAIFTRPIPQPAIYEHIHLSRRNAAPFIQVDELKVIGVSTASVVQIGTNRIIQAESRTKHIRQYMPIVSQTD